MKKSNLQLKFIIIILALILFNKISDISAQTDIPIIYVNGVELKFRTLEEEKEYFKENNTNFIEYIGQPFIENNVQYIPLKKSADLMDISYTIKNDIVSLIKDDITIEIKIGSTTATLYKNSKQMQIKTHPIKNINKNIYISIGLLDYLNFKIDAITPKNIIYINHKENTIQKIDQEKYQEVVKDIKNERKSVGNEEDVNYFLNDKNLGKILLLNTDEKDSSKKITIPKGKYLEKFHYGKMIFIKNGKIVGYPKRIKEKNTLSYYINIGKTYYMQNAYLDLSDEIIIFCPYCKSEYIIKIKNPFRICDCE